MSDANDWYEEDLRDEIEGLRRIEANGPRLAHRSRSGLRALRLHVLLEPSRITSSAGTYNQHNQESHGGLQHRQTPFFRMSYATHPQKVLKRYEMV